MKRRWASALALGAVALCSKSWAEVSEMCSVDEAKATSLKEIATQAAKLDGRCVRAEGRWDGMFLSDNHGQMVGLSFWPKNPVQKTKKLNVMGRIMNCRGYTEQAIAEYRADFMMTGACHVYDSWVVIAVQNVQEPSSKQRK